MRLPELLQLSLKLVCTSHNSQRSVTVLPTTCIICHIRQFSYFQWFSTSSSFSLLSAQGLVIFCSRNEAQLTDSPLLLLPLWSLLSWLEHQGGESTTVVCTSLQISPLHMSLSLKGLHDGW